jgi:hypothetical protein
MDQADRFSDAPYVVEDHPFDRGYFDRVLFKCSYENEERSRRDQKKYRDGYEQARRELHAERLKQ